MVFKFNRIFYKQAVEILSRCRDKQRLIRVCTVCIRPTKTTFGYMGKELFVVPHVNISVSNLTAIIVLYNCSQRGT